MGHCVGCPMSRATLKNGIESRLRMAVPEVRSVEAV
jgi:Fe-S cluster biogenesis protein NfuA